jgi:hypothetical protein
MGLYVLKVIIIIKQVYLLQKVLGEVRELSLVKIRYPQREIGLLPADQEPRICLLACLLTYLLTYLSSSFPLEHRASALQLLRFL